MTLFQSNYNKLQLQCRTDKSYGQLELFIGVHSTQCAIVDTHEVHSTVTHYTEYVIL